MLNKIKKKYKNILRSIKNHIMLKKEIYGFAVFMLSILFLFIAVMVTYNYSIYKETQTFYKKQSSIEFENLIEDIKKNKFSYYSKNSIYPESLDFSQVWYDTRKVGIIDVYLFTYQDGKTVLYAEDSLKTGSINAKKEDKEVATAMFSLKTLPSKIITFVPFSIREIVNSLVWILGFVFIIFAAQFLVAELMSGKNFSQKKIDTDIEFDDIVGYDDVKEQFLDISKYIKNKKYFDKNSISVPRGILLTGEPGVGKTLFAKAFANNVNATLFFASGSDFAEMYVGVGAKRVRSLFRSAALASPAVIFIDEFDAIGSRNNMGQDSERVSVINQLLTEMDGLSKKEDIFVIATTNYESKIDPALLRPGRIDKTINIPMPDKETRIAIMKRYLGEFEAQEGALEQLSIKTQNMSAASLRNLIEQAKSYVIKKQNGEIKDKFISYNDLSDAFENILMGRKTDLKIKDIQEKTISFHELGHAFIAQIMCPEHMVEKVSIESRGKALGQTLIMPKDEMFLHTKTQLTSLICMLLGGRAAEEIFMGEISNGAYDDLQKANNIAHDMINKYGMGEKTSLLVDIFPNNPIKMELELKQRQQLLQDCYLSSLNVLKYYIDDIKKLNQILLQQRTISGDLIKNIVENKPYPFNDGYELKIEDLNDDEKIKIQQISS